MYRFCLFFNYFVCYVVKDLFFFYIKCDSIFFYFYFINIDNVVLEYIIYSSVCIYNCIYNYVYI